MKIIKRFFVLLTVVTNLLFLAPVSQASAAFDPFSDACKGGSSSSMSGSKSVVCKDKVVTSDPITGNNGVIMKAINTISFITGVAAVILIILAGLRFVTSGGGSEDVAGARRTIIYALIGLIVIVLARSLVQFTLGKL